VMCKARGQWDELKSQGSSTVIERVPFLCYLSIFSWNQDGCVWDLVLGGRAVGLAQR
jgi:hypothetical protein